MTILCQDSRILVCLKPAGVVSVDEPGGMPALLRQALGDAHACVRTVHRLDAAAGGVMVFARSRMASSILSQQIRERKFQKEYLAVICGQPDASEGTLTMRLGYDRVRRMAYAAQPDDPAGKDAVLDYRVLGVREDMSLVRVRLHTGRTHQIRAQFALCGHPLLGDRKYGGAGAESLALWSCKIGFYHPQTGEWVSFSALPPKTAPWDAFSEINWTKGEKSNQ